VAPEPAPQERPADPLEAQKLQFFKEQFAKCRLTVLDRPNEPCELVAEPLLKFDNPISHIHDGFMFAWTDRGRPVAVAKSYRNVPQKSWGRTFVSIAPGKLELREANQLLWSPTEAGVSFAALAEEVRPAATRRQRLAQMREIARRFTVVDRWGLKEPTDWQLRLLSTPLLRYEVPDEDVVDGAMFGYALSTSPEALLLVEAREEAGGLRWHYAVSRSTRFELTISLGDRQIAAFPRLETWPPSGTYFHSPLPWPEYPFEADAPSE
jgi:hypothetical protein